MSEIKIIINDKSIKNNDKIIFKKNINKLSSLYNFFYLLIISFIFYNFIIYTIFYSLKKKIIFFKNDYKNLKNERLFPKIVAISYGNKDYKMQLELNKKSAIEIGKVDEYYSYSPDKIDSEFKEKNKDILSRKRGNGYWLWKPYFILKTFREKLNYGDYLIYTDAGILYMNSTYNIINFLKYQKAEMWMIPLDYQEKQYTKRDAFILLGADIPFYTDTPQFMAGIQIYKKSTFTEKFLEELLYYSQDKRIITDDPNTQGLPNYDEFKENRHDQSILSLLIKKYGQCNTGRTNTNIDFFQSRKILMPFIFCIYRRMEFNNYEDLREKCIKDIKDSK